MILHLKGQFDEAAGLTTFINPYSYRVLRRSDLDMTDFVIYCDGILLALFASLLGKERVKRFSFDDTSLASMVLQNANNNEFRVGLIGSSEAVISAASELVKSKYNGISVVYHHGYFSEHQFEEVMTEFLDCDVVISSMGTPRQERALLTLKEKGWRGKGYTCGGYFDQLVLSGGGAYYPKVIDALDLRWLYRIWKEPKRLLGRYVFDYPMGVFWFVLDYLRGRIRID